MNDLPVGIWIPSEEDRDHLSNLAMESDCEVQKEYEALDVRKLLDSPQWSKVVSDLKRGVIECLMVQKMAKLCRKFSELVKAVQVFEKYGGRIYFVEEQISTSSDIGILWISILQFFMKFERKLISDLLFSTERS